MRVVIALLSLLCLAGCGEDWADYHKPANPESETDWHRCMRQHDPVHRSACRDLR